MQSSRCNWCQRDRHCSPRLRTRPRVCLLIFLLPPCDISQYPEHVWSCLAASSGGKKKHCLQKAVNSSRDDPPTNKESLKSSLSFSSTLSFGKKIQISSACFSFEVGWENSIFISRYEQPYKVRNTARKVWLLSLCADQISYTCCSEASQKDSAGTVLPHRDGDEQ